LGDYLGLHWQFGVVQNAVSASASGGFSLSDTTDIVAFSNPTSDGDVVTVTNNASGHSTCTFGFTMGGATLTVGTFSDQDFGNRIYTDIIAWEGNSNMLSGSDISEGSNLVDDLVGTWYFKIINRTDASANTTGQTITVVQTVDSSIVTNVTFTVA
tara:strand:- start:21683 stop:22150 length:468 start_codon:yes stop_codon:yes gene_type:complete